MQLDLRAQRQPPHDQIGVCVTRKQRGLKENQAGRPDGGRAAEPRQDLFRDTGWTRKSRKALAKIVAA